jgi:hypothetical protein
MVSEYWGWGYDRIVCAFANLGHVVCDQTAGNVPRSGGLVSAPRRRLHSASTTPWPAFIRIHLTLLTGIHLFHRGNFHRGNHAAWAGDLLCAVLYPSREPSGGDRWDHGSPGRAVDEANGPQCDALSIFEDTIDMMCGGSNIRNGTGSGHERKDAHEF